MVPQHGEADGPDGVGVEGGQQNVQQPTTTLRMRMKASREEVRGPLPGLSAAEPLFVYELLL